MATGGDTLDPILDSDLAHPTHCHVCHHKQSRGLPIPDSENSLMSWLVLGFFQHQGLTPPQKKQKSGSYGGWKIPGPPPQRADPRWWSLQLWRQPSLRLGGPMSVEKGCLQYHAPNMASRDALAKPCDSQTSASK